jgi:hypothetical protein
VAASQHRDIREWNQRAPGELHIHEKFGGFRHLRIRAKETRSLASVGLCNNF